MVDTANFDPTNALPTFNSNLFLNVGITVLVFVSLTLLFSIINTHKSGAHLMLGFIITGFALCLGHLVSIVLLPFIHI